LDYAKLVRHQKLVQRPHPIVKWQNVLTEHQPGGGHKIELFCTKTCFAPNPEVSPVPKVICECHAAVGTFACLATGSRAADSMPPMTPI
jgi:hypothetical protein